MMPRRDRSLLTISEKTVSSHISNLLRETGAANRVDLARMSQRREPGNGRAVAGE